MDWFMLTAMVIAGWAVLSVFASERLSRQPQQAASNVGTAGTQKATPAPSAA